MVCAGEAAGAERLLLDLVTHAAEDDQSRSLITGRCCRIVEAPMDTLHVSGKYRALLARIVTDRDHVIEFLSTEFIELAGKVNQQMPYFCLEKAERALNDAGKPVRGSRILVLGVSYKADIGDIRESPALKIAELLRAGGAEVAYHDPFVPELADHGLSSVALDPGAYDCVVIATAHSAIDYEKLVEEANLVVDFRNATQRNEKVWRL